MLSQMIRRSLLALALLPALLLARPAAAQITCPVTATTPQFTQGGNVFGRIASQWNSYFGAKADANNGVLCNPTIIGGSGLFSFTARPGLTNAPGNRNTAGKTINLGGLLYPQLYPVRKTSSYVVNSDFGSTSDSGALLVAAGSSLTFTLPNPSITTTGTPYNFSSDGVHPFTLITPGGIATFYGCQLAATTLIQGTGSVQVVDDGTNYVCKTTPPPSSWVTIDVTAAPYFAVPDGITDTAPQVQAALNANAAGGTRYLFPCGNYVLNEPLTSNGNPIGLDFARGCVTMTQKHTGVGLTLAQSDVSHVVMINGGNVTWNAVNSSVATRAIDVSWPTNPSYTQESGWISDVHCNPTQPGLPMVSPYPNAYLNCIRVTHGWYVTIDNVTASNPFITATSYIANSAAIDVHATSDATACACAYSIRNLNSTNYEIGIAITGYSEGLVVINPTTVDGNYGIKVGGRRVQNSGQLTGTSGITARANVLFNQINVYGGSFTSNQAGILADTGQLLATKDISFNSYASGITNLYAGVWLADTQVSNIDGLFQSNLGTNSWAVLLTHQSTCPTGVSSCGTTSNTVKGTAVNLTGAVKALNGAYGNTARMSTGGATVQTPNGYQIAYPAFVDNLAYGGAAPSNDLGPTEVGINGSNIAPGLAGSTTAGTWTPSSAYFNYRFEGRDLVISDLVIAGTLAGASGFVTIPRLPYQMSSTVGQEEGFCTFAAYDGFTFDSGYTVLNGVIFPGTKVAMLYESGSHGGIGATPLPVANISGTAIIRGSCRYRVY